MASKNSTAAADKKPGKRTECPVSREQFADKAQPKRVSIDGKDFVASVKEFSSGGLGWNINEKGVMEVDGVPCKVQIGLNISIIGSKDLPAA